MLRKFGIHETEGVDNFLASILEDLVGNKDITFKELYDKTGIWLTVTYLSLNYGRTIFADYIYEPDSLVRKTVVKSCTIPIFYEAYTEGKGVNKTMDIDGGMIVLSPIKVLYLQGWDPNDILAFNFVSPDTQNLILSGKPGNPNEWTESPANIVDFLYSFVQVLRRHAELLYTSPEDDMLTVKINVGNLTSTSFNLSATKKEWLYNQGQLAVEDYLDELTQLLKDGKMPIQK